MNALTPKDTPPFSFPSTDPSAQGLIHNFREYLGRIYERTVDGITLIAAVAALGLVGQTGWSRIVSPWLANRPLPAEEWNDLVDAGRRVGPVDAEVTMVAFFDYECPGCRNVEPVLQSMLRMFPDTFAVVYRHWPLPYHSSAYGAARAVECAGEQNAFEGFHRALFDGTAWQQSPSEYSRLAKEAGVPDLAAFNACTAHTDPVPSIEADIAAAIAVGGQGTPTLIVNRRTLLQLPSEERMIRLIRGRSE